MKDWKRLAIAAVVGAGLAVPAFAGDGDGLQSPENQHGNKVERNPIISPSSQATPVPAWDSVHGARITDDLSTAPGIPSASSSNLVSPSMYGAPSAAEEGHATGKVDADTAAPPQTGADVQAGDMGPANAKGGTAQ